MFARSELIVKVKEPQRAEIEWLSSDHVLFTYLHLAALGPMRSGATCIAYETVTDDQGGLPLLAPMSEIAGRLSIQVGAHHLEKKQGGRGVLLGGVAGVAPAKVVVLGGGVSGFSAARMAIGLGVDVAVVDRSLARLKELEELCNGRVRTLYAMKDNVEQDVASADLVVGAVLVPAASAPKLVTRGILSQMKRGAVLVDIAIDQGGCFETSHPTTHAEPTFLVDGVIHYCVANMPIEVISANTQDRDCAADLIKKALRKHPRLRKLFADGGYAGPKLASAPVSIEIVKRTDKDGGFKVIRRRWFIERTFSWLRRNRRLMAHYEAIAMVAVHFAKLAMISLMLKRLTEP